MRCTLEPAEGIEPKRQGARTVHYPSNAHRNGRQESSSNIKRGKLEQTKGLSSFHNNSAKPPKTAPNPYSHNSVENATLKGPVTRRDTCSAACRRGDEHLVLAVGAANASEPFLQIAALEKGCHGLLDDRPPVTVLGLIALVVDLLEECYGRFAMPSTSVGFRNSCWSIMGRSTAAKKSR